MASGKNTSILQANDIVGSIAFSPDGDLLASGSHDKTISLWDVGMGKKRATLEGYSVTFSPDGKTLASWTPDGVIKLWDIPVCTKTDK